VLSDEVVRVEETEEAEAEESEEEVRDDSDTFAPFFIAFFFSFFSVSRTTSSTGALCPRPALQVRHDRARAELRKVHTLQFHFPFWATCSMSAFCGEAVVSDADPETGCATSSVLSSLSSSSALLLLPFSSDSPLVSSFFFENVGILVSPKGFDGAQERTTGALRFMAFVMRTPFPLPRDRRGDVDKLVGLDGAISDGMESFDANCCRAFFKRMGEPEKRRQRKF